jgi:PAS domain S-box-containing protein
MRPDLDPNESNQFFTLSLDMLCVAGFDAYFRQVNPAWEKALGWTGDELQAKPYLEFIHSEDRRATLAQARNLIGGADVIYFENRYLCRDGSYPVLSWHTTSFPEEQLIYAVARDVTEQRRIDERFQKILETAPDAMVIVNFVRDGAEALEFIFGTGQYAGRSLKGGPKVILLDLKLPKVDGLEVLRKPKADTRAKSLPVVMLTSSQEDRDIIESYRLGVNSYIVKPVEFEQFTQAVQDLGFYWLLLNQMPGYKEEP